MLFGLYADHRLSRQGQAVHRARCLHGVPRRPAEMYWRQPTEIRRWIDVNGGHQNLPLNGYWTMHDRDRRPPETHCPPLASAISAEPGAPRTLRTTRRAASSSAARTRTRAMSFAAKVNSFMVPPRSLPPAAFAALFGPRERKKGANSRTAAVFNHPRVLPQGQCRFGPTLAGSMVGRHRDLEILDASHVLDDEI